MRKLNVIVAAVFMVVMMASSATSSFAATEDGMADADDAEAALESGQAIVWIPDPPPEESGQAEFKLEIDTGDVSLAALLNAYEKWREALRTTCTVTAYEESATDSSGAVPLWPVFPPVPLLPY